MIHEVKGCTAWASSASAMRRRSFSTRIAEWATHSTPSCGGYTRTLPSTTPQGKPQDGRSPTALIKKRAKKGTVAPAGTFKPYILKVLLAAPGYKLRIGDVIRAVETLVKPKLSAVDYERLASGGVVRWENRCQWDRAEMVNDKLLEPPAISGRGNWMLSAKGVAEAKKLP
jgi:hypothetical protein